VTGIGARRALVVEDEPLIAMLIEDMLVELGFAVVGPAARLERAMAMAREESFDLAILDINLGNEQSFAVADVLSERGIPFVFATGYGVRGLDARFERAVTLQKPFASHDLEHAISQALVPGN
jgi:DNA-binding response OmpR family regulator